MAQTGRDLGYHAEEGSFGGFLLGLSLLYYSRSEVDAMRHDTLAPWAEIVPDARYPMTADDLLVLADDAWQYELVDGRLVRMAPTGLEHLDITERLYDALRTFVTLRGLGRVTLPDTGFRLSQPGEHEVVVSPDVAYISTERVRQLPPRGAPARKRFLAVAPDLAAEIVSPDQYHPEMAKKAHLYLEKGVHLVWIVWPDQQQVDVWRPGSDVAVATLGIGETLNG
jgi:Uma2 family endonuclease